MLKPEKEPPKNKDPPATVLYVKNKIKIRGSQILLTFNHGGTYVR